MIETPYQVAQRHERQRRLHGEPGQEDRCVNELEVRLAEANERIAELEGCWKHDLAVAKRDQAAFVDTVDDLTSRLGQLAEVTRERDEYKAGFLAYRAGCYTDEHAAIRAAAKLAKPPPFAGNPNEPLVGGLEPAEEAEPVLENVVVDGAVWVVLTPDAATCLAVSVVPERTHLSVSRFGRNKVEGGWHEYGEVLSEDFIPLDVLRQLIADHDKESG